MKSCFVRFDKLTGMVRVAALEDAQVGDQVVCALDKGECLGTVATEPVEVSGERNLKKMLRKATEEEISAFQSLRLRERQAFEACQRRIQDMKIPMKLLQAEYLFGGSKLLFYFFSENRIDFRELVKDLAKEFKVRIEMRQVGVRDEAKIVGGLGNCGNVVCCRRFLNNFSIVSIKMMKEQSLALNPSKISGVCGRLMCCLAYEYEMYVELKKDFPKVGKRISLPQGEGKVIKHNALGATITIGMDDGKELTLPAKEVIDNMRRS